MITDNHTNFIYLADTLPLKYPKFCEEFCKIFNYHNIGYAFLKNTKDVWAVDYMPIQVEKDKFVQFIYNPDYLRNTVKWKKTISNIDLICSDININPKKSNLILDGGNLIKWSDKVIMCDKVFFENPDITPKKLIEQLEYLFQVDKIIFIPTFSDDIIGHADGMIRFYDDKTVIVNDFSNEKKENRIRFFSALHNVGLSTIEIPYNPYVNPKSIDATGIYINYLQLNKKIVLPIFNIKEDEVVVKKFEELFPKNELTTINSRELAVNGGVLNCITWNILK